LALAVKELFKSDTPINYIGIRHGEKRYETLLTKEECLHATDLGNYYRVPADNRDLNYEQYFEYGKNDKVMLEEFTSDNTIRLNIEQIMEKLITTDFIKEELIK